MTGRSRALAAIALAVLAPARIAAADASALLERLDRPLAVERGPLRVELSGLADLEGYYVDRRPAGLLFGGEDSFFNPRLTLFADARLGRRWYAFTEARVDRGFDPRASDTAAFRFDQYLLRFAPLADGRVSVQAGKFASVMGNWVARHDSWTNPFINAPLPYENVTIVSDGPAAPSRGAFLDRRHLADRKTRWVPVLWGPGYASGAAVFGRIDRADYALEVKNAAPSSRPAVWDARQRGFAHPTVSGRLGWRPSAAWALGVSGSGGPYLREKAEHSLAAGHHVGDYHQYVVAADASFARRHLELWAEAFAARFEVPRVGGADTFVYYVEGRYKLTPRLFAALRWNQQLFGDVPNSVGDDRAWDRSGWRVDTAFTYRFGRHLQGKLQYSYFRQRGDVQQGEQLVAAQLTLKF